MPSMGPKMRGRSVRPAAKKTRSGGGKSAKLAALKI